MAILPASPTDEIDSGTLLTALETCALNAGLRTLRLETNRALKEAQQLYRRSRYREVAPFNTEPYAHHWFEKHLGPRPRKPTSPLRR